MNEIETLTTINSTYEIDRSAKKVRRVTGVNPPTGRFEADGVWHEFDHISDTYWGGVAIFWPEGTVTVTSAREQA